MLPGKKITPSEILQMVKRRVWLLALPPAVTTFAALLYSASLPNVYKSDMLIAIVPQRVPDAFVRSTVTLRTEERLDALAVQVKSRTYLEQIIAEYDLYPVERQRLPMEDVVARMRAGIEVELEQPRRGPRGPEPPHAFHVRFTYTDPQIAARVAQRLGSLFVEQNSRDRGALADATDQFLESQLAEAREKLEAQERRLEAFRQQYGKELPTQMQGNMQAIQSAQLQIQALVESIARDRDRKLMLERLYNEAASDPVVVSQGAAAQAQPQPGEVPRGGTAKQQLAAARESLARLELRLKPEHPDIVRARRLIAELEPKAGAESDRDEPAAGLPAVSVEEAARRERLRQMAAEIESLDRQTRFKESEEVRLRAQVAEYQRRIEAVPGIEAEWASLTRDYDTQQAAYRELLNKSEASKVAVNLEKRQIGEHFRILDPAAVPTHPISPVRLQINGIGFLVGLLLGVGLAALLELKDGSFRTDRDVLDVLLLPVLAVVPYVSTQSERTTRRRWRWMLGLGAAVLVMGSGYVFWSQKLWNFVM